MVKEKEAYDARLRQLFHKATGLQSAPGFREGIGQADLAQRSRGSPRASRAGRAELMNHELVCLFFPFIPLHACNDVAPNR